MCAGELLHPASLPLAALFFLLLSPRLLAAVTKLRYALPINVNTPLCSAMNY